jgi:hypothetical protein
MAVTRRLVGTMPGRPMLEGIKQDLYDTKVYPALGINQLEFFRNPAAGELLSNMQSSGQLPHPQEFHILGIAVEIIPNIAAAVATRTDVTWVQDKRNILSNAYIKFNVGTKNYLTLPLMRVPEGLGEVGIGAGGAGSVAECFLNNGIPDINHYYDVTIKLAKRKPIHIPSQQSFYAQIFWPVVTPTGLSSLIGAIRVYLIGILWREIQ